MNHCKLSRAEKGIVFAVPILFAAGSLLHFLYGALGNNPVVGLVAPVNESIWEHEKLVFWPMLLWWLAWGRQLNRKGLLDGPRWWEAALLATAAALAIPPSLYYFYTGALGVHVVWADILLFLLAVLLGQCLGLHVYRHGRGIDPQLALLLFIAMALGLAFLTFFPPRLPLFQDGPTGGYGILPPGLEAGQAFSAVSP